MNTNEMLGTKPIQANPTSSEQPQSVEVQNMDLKEQSAGYIVKVTTIKLFNIVKLTSCNLTSRPRSTNDTLRLHPRPSRTRIMRGRLVESTQFVILVYM